ncbi:hypothetical protein A1D22_09435 [Pasteurellaceae bacterium LFhippo2]|nr:hypothetical protein [Pasteurellaceae bacterium LFhippo2]
MTKFYTLLTQLGEQAIAQAIANNEPLPFVQMAIGDGNGKAITPTVTHTKLVREVYRANITDVLLDQSNNKQVICELLVPENVGDFTVREIGLFDGNGGLLAIANTPENYKPVLESGSGKVQYYRMVIRVSSSDQVNISINNNIVYTTRTEFNQFVSDLTNSDGFKLIGQCESIADLRNIEPIADQQRILVKSWHKGLNKGGGEFYADFSDSESEDNGGTVIITAGGKRWKRILSNTSHLNINEFGASGESISLDTQAIINAAKFSDGTLSLFIPYSEIEFAQYTNVKNCNIIGCNTYIKGDLKGHGKLENVFISSQSQNNIYHIESTTQEPTVGLYTSINGKITFVYVPKSPSSTSAVVFELIKDVTTTANSLGGEQDLFRAAITHNLSHVFFYLQNGEKTGSWQEKSRWEAPLLNFTGNVYQKLSYITGNYNSGIKFKLQASNRNTTNLAFIKTIGSSENIEISVNDVKVKEINARSSVNKLEVVDIPIQKYQENTISLNIKNEGVLHLVGVNFNEINNLSPNVQYDNVFSIKPSLTHYIKNQGANEYAVFESKSNLWGGSYHGGETLLSGTMIDINNNRINLSPGEYRAVEGFKIIQNTRLNFSKKGGDDIDVSSITSFCFAGIEFLGSMSGNGAEIYHLFSAMNCVDVGFNQIIFPIKNNIDATGIYDLKLGNHNKVVYFNNEMNSIITSEYTLQPILDNDRGGAYINPEKDIYNKLYYGHINGKQTINNFAFSSRRVFK